MRTLARIALLACTLGLSLAVQAADAFRIGVAPHTSARVIVAQYQPLRLHLEAALGQPVEIVTAPNFTDFARRALEQQYDIAITTGHQARLLQTDAGHLPLLTYKADFKALAIVAANGPVKKSADLRGQKTLGLSPSSLVTLWGIHWLRDEGLQDAPIEFVSASDSVSQLVATGKAGVGFISQANYDRLRPELKEQIRILTSSASMAGRVYMLNGRHAALRGKVMAALGSFAETEPAKQGFAATNLDGYRNLKPGELESMDRYADEVRQALRK